MRVSIVLLCVQLAIFALRFIYNACFELRDPFVQPEGYLRVKNGMKGWHVWTSLFCVIALWVNGWYLFGLLLVVAQYVALHFLRFFNYRRAVQAIAESRYPTGDYVLSGDIAERERVAMSIVNEERERGLRV
jgi:hypothetical protein